MKSRSDNIKNTLQHTLVIGLVTALSSELYFSMLVDNFRISPAVVFFPVLLCTTCREDSVPLLSVGTSLIVGAARCLLNLGTANLFETVFPGAFFYTVYGCLFQLLLRNRYTASIIRMSLFAAVCDALSNLVEIEIRRYLISGTLEGALMMTRILQVALIRGVLVYTLFLLNQQYHFLLKRSEHEERYQQLFLITSELKSELYVMRKNCEQIEGIMKEAYLLYEDMKQRELPPEVQSRGLRLASEVHDIKKDYFRVIQGIEDELGKNPDTEAMKVEDLFRVLNETGKKEIVRRNQDTQIRTEIGWPFATHQHYLLMSILFNLMTNAIEALEGVDRRGLVNIEETLEDGYIVFRVKDNGQGISAHRLPHIFEMGYSSKFNEVTGNVFRGMGLCSVKQLTEEQLKGRIEVESEVDRGTVFTVILPLDTVTGA